MVVTNIASPSHYQKGSMQPIEIMQEHFSPEQFEGFLLGNVLKYAMRYGKKDEKCNEAAKICQYAKWLLLHSVGEKINPRV